MDEPKIPLPSWLPWATTACLAAVVACIGELWNVEKARGRLLKDEALMAEAALKGAENQLEAERIVERRQWAETATRDLRIEWLQAPRGPRATAHGGERAQGALVWQAGSTRILLKVTGLKPLPPPGRYQLWQEDPNTGKTEPCGELAGDGDARAEAAWISLASPVGPKCRFYLVESESGTPLSPAEAQNEGSIVLASPSSSGKIPNR